MPHAASSPPPAAFDGDSSRIRAALPDPASLKAPPLPFEERDTSEVVARPATPFEAADTSEVRAAAERERAEDSMEIDLDAPMVSEPPPGWVLPEPIGGIGRYEVFGELGSGGMADIYLAREQTSGGGQRLVVVKGLREALRAEGRFEEMFLREGRVAVQLNHPNICTVYDFGTTESGRYYLAMEHVEGVTLRDVLVRCAQRDERMPVELAVGAIVRVAAALDHAHHARDAQRRKLGVVHRDVTPHNVMLRWDGVVKLLDFGVAKVRVGEDQTRTTSIKGKLGYLAPEQALAGEVDARTDVFALGVCLFEALTGRRLYRRESEFATLKAILEEPAPSLLKHLPTAPATLDKILRKALAKDKARRHASAAELQHELEEFLARRGRHVGTAAIRDYLAPRFADELREGPKLDASAKVKARLEPLGDVRSSMAPPGGSAEERSSKPPTRAVRRRALDSIEQSTDSFPTLTGPRLRPRWIWAAAALLLAVGVGIGAWLALDGAAPQAQRLAPDPAMAPTEAEAPEAETPAGEAPAGEASAPVTMQSAERAEAEGDEALPTLGVPEPIEEPAAEASEPREARPRRERSRRERAREREAPRERPSAPGFVRDPGF
ncbi:MAG: hypothetical protein CMN31_05930 [Sandaracinus sp.]|nr:hypothetical protein [Sandaracinus sp.]